MKILKENWFKIGAALILIIIAAAVYHFYSTKNAVVVKSPQELAIENRGLAEFDPENNNTNTVAPQDKKLAEEMMPIFKEMGDGKNNAKNKEAVLALGKIIRKYPEYPDAYILRATISLEAGENDYKKILSDIDNAIKFYPQNKYKITSGSMGGMYGLRAKVDILSNNYQQALNDIETILKNDSTKEGEVFNTGGVKPEDDSNPTALQKKDFDLLVAKYPEDYRTYMLRGLFYNSFSFYDNKYYKPAIDDLTKAISINPKSPLAYYFLGNVYQKAAFFIYSFKNLGGTSAYDQARDAGNERALEYFKQAAKIDSNFSPAYAQIAESLYSLKRYKESIPYFDRVIELNPNDAGSYNDRGLAKTYINEYYDAISDFSKAIDLKKEKPDLSLGLENTYENRANAYIKVVNYDSAIEDFSKAIGLKFANQVFLMSTTQIRAVYPEFNDISDADLLEGLRRKYFPDMSPEDFVGQYKKNDKPFEDFILAGLYGNRGDAYWSAGNFKKAAAEYTRAFHDWSKFTLDRWKVISKTPDFEYSVDTQTLDFSKRNIVSLWAKILAKNTDTYSQTNFEINCFERKIRSVSITNYDAMGNVIGTIPPQEWQNIVPETIGEILHNGMCRN